MSRSLQASLPVVDNNRKVVGALSDVGKKFSKSLADFSKNLQNFQRFLNKKIELCENAAFWEKSRNVLVKDLKKFSKLLTKLQK